MEVVIRKPGKDLVKFLLDKATEEAMDLKVVRLLPDGLYLPIELADIAGLLDAYKTPVEEKNDGADDGAGRDAEPPKRATRKRSSAKSKEASTEEVFEETSPWD